jgi:hypothetical protein
VVVLIAVVVAVVPFWVVGVDTFTEVGSAPLAGV